MAAPHVFDRALIATHLRRRPANVDDFVTKLVLADLEDRLETVTRTFEQAVILAPDAALMPSQGRSATGTFGFERLSTILCGAFDPDALALPRRDYDLIVSILDLQVIDDVPGYLAQLRAHLRPDGLFLAAALGGDTLTELRQAFLLADSERHGGSFARVSPFIPVAEVGPLLQRARFGLPVADVETHVVRYATPLKLMQELKRLGAANPLFDKPDFLMTPTHLASASAHYEALAGDPDGRVRATLEIVWMSGWAPHDSQQKPLKPGSAEISLTKVLGKR